MFLDTVLKHKVFCIYYRLGITFPSSFVSFEIFPFSLSILVEGQFLGMSLKVALSNLVEGQFLAISLKSSS